MAWRVVRRWVLASVLVAALAGFAVLQVVGAPVWGAVAAGGTAVLGVVVPLAVERVRRRPAAADAPASIRPGRLPTVAGALDQARRGSDRWSRLGVHAAIPLDHADPALSSSLPRYVVRDVDARVRTWFVDAAGSGGFLLLVGGSSVGKTRMAMEAIGQEPLLGWRFLRPTSAGDVTGMATTVGRGGTVVWLDEIQNFLTGNDTLAFDTVARLLDTGRVILVGTIWPDTFDRFTSAPVTPEQDPLKDARLILQRAHRQDVSAVFSDEELARAAVSSDPRLHEAVRSGPRVTEALAAVPDLVRRWRHGSDEFGVLVVTAATLCRRAGHPDTLPHGLLAAATTALLSDRQRPRAQEDWFAAALAWAQEPVRGQSSPLWPVGVTPGTTHGYEVADALVQNAALDAASPNRELDLPLWTAVVTNTDANGCTAMISTLNHRTSALTEEKAVRLMILRRLAEFDDADAMYMLAGQLVGFGFVGQGVTEAARQESREWYQRAAERGHEKAMLAFAGDLVDAGREEEALHWYARAAEQEEVTGRSIAQYNLAVLLDQLGRLDEAETAYRTAIEDGTWAAAYPLATMLREADRADEAEQVYRRAADAGQANAMTCLGELAVEAGRTEDAEHWFRRTLEADGSEVSALVNLGVLRYESDAEDEAEELWCRAADLGVTEAMANLGFLCRAADRTDDAQRWWQQAADEGHIDAMANLGALLYDKGDAQAEHWLRQAAEGDDAAAMNNLAGLLAKADRPGEAETWWERAAEAGLAVAAVNLASWHEDNGRAAQATEWFRRAYEADPDVLGALGYQAEEADRPDDAEALYRRGAELGDTGLMTMLGLLLNQQGSLDEAETWCRRAAERSEPIAMYQLGVLMVSSGRDTEGMDWLRRSADGGLTDAATVLANFAEDTGDADEEQRWRQRATELGEPT